MPGTEEVPLSRGEPSTQRPVTWARSARMFRRSTSKRRHERLDGGAHVDRPDAGDRLRAGQLAEVGPLERDRQAGHPQLAEAAGRRRGLRRGSPAGP